MLWINYSYYYFKQLFLQISWCDTWRKPSKSSSILGTYFPLLWISVWENSIFYTIPAVLPPPLLSSFTSCIMINQKKPAESFKATNITNHLDRFDKSYWHLYLNLSVVVAYCINLYYEYQRIHLRNSTWTGFKKTSHLEARRLNKKSDWNMKSESTVIASSQVVFILDRTGIVPCVKGRVVDITVFAPTVIGRGIRTSQRCM